MICEECRFEDVRPVWSSELWPGRTSAIESNSAMKWLGGIDLSLMKSRPTFWRVTENSVTVGVLSGHFGGHFDGDTDERSYRTRGLWVAPSHRRRGVARMLMLAAFQQARKENCDLIWTFPRETSMPFYSAMGFELVGAWIRDDDPQAGEFGPNGFALAKTDRHEATKAP